MSRPDHVGWPEGLQAERGAHCQPIARTRVTDQSGMDRSGKPTIQEPTRMDREEHPTFPTIPGLTRLDRGRRSTIQVQRNFGTKEAVMYIY